MVTIDELADQAGVPVRTVRYYISEGLLAGPDGRGKAAAYDAAHLARLRLIRRLADQHVPLAEQRAQLAGLSAGDVAALLHDQEHQQASAPSPQAYVSQLLSRARVSASPIAAASPPAAVSPPAAPEPTPTPQPPQEWRRWQLAPGVELHVRADALSVHPRLIERLLHLGRVSEAPRYDQ